MKRVQPVLLLLALLLLGAGGAALAALGFLDSDAERAPPMLDTEPDSAATLEGQGHEQVVDLVRDPLVWESQAAWSLEVWVQDREDARPLPGATVRVWLTRPGVRQALCEGTSDDNGRVTFDVSAIDRVPPVLRAVSRLEVDGSLPGWFPYREEMGKNPGEPETINIPAWPSATPRTTKITCRLSDEGQVRGRVLSAAGQPVAGAVVRLGTQQLQTLTRADGHFHLPVEQSVRAEVYVAHSRLGRYESEELDVVADRETQLGDVALRAPARLTGRIVDRRGRPIPGLALTFKAHGFPMGGRYRRGSPYRTETERSLGRTSADGRFALPVHASLLQAETRPHRLFRLDAEGLTSPSLHLPLERVWGSEQERGDIVIEHHLVRAIVALPDGTPVPKAEVEAALWTSAAARRAQPDQPDVGTEKIHTDATGHFKCWLGVGVTVRLRVLAQHAQPLESWVTAPAQTGVEELRLVVQPVSGASGIVVRGVGADGQDVENLSCVVQDSAGRVVTVRKEQATDVRLPLPPGRYRLKLHSKDRRDYGHGVGRKSLPRYQLSHHDVVVPEEGDAALEHRFEEWSYVRIWPALEKGGNTLVAVPLHAKLLGDDPDNPVGDWNGHWWFEGDLGYAQAVATGTHDLEITGKHTKTRHLRIKVGAGELVDARVTLEWKTED